MARPTGPARRMGSLVTHTTGSGGADSRATSGGISRASLPAAACSCASSVLRARGSSSSVSIGTASALADSRTALVSSATSESDAGVGSAARGPPSRASTQLDLGELHAAPGHVVVMELLRRRAFQDGRRGDADGAAMPPANPAWPRADRDRQTHRRQHGSHRSLRARLQKRRLAPPRGCRSSTLSRSPGSGHWELVLTSSGSTPPTRTAVKCGWPNFET